MSPHRHQIRVYWEDTDAGGIVYHSNYLNFAERARSEWVRTLGLDQRALAEGGHAFAVRRAEVDFRRPARLDDMLEVETRATGLGGASLDLAQTITRLDDGVELACLQIRLAFISLEGRPARIPAPVRDCLRALESERR